LPREMSDSSSERSRSVSFQYFDVQLLGDRREALLTPNPSFPGRHIRRPPPP
jgi:hypothetical protein